MLLILSITFAFILPFNAKPKLYLIDTNDESSQKPMEILEENAVTDIIETLDQSSDEGTEKTNGINNPQSVKQAEEILESFLEKHSNAPQSVKQLVRREQAYLADNVKPINESKEIKYVKPALKVIESYLKQGKLMNNNYDDYSNEGTRGSINSNNGNYSDYHDSNAICAPTGAHAWNSLKGAINGFNFFFIAPYIRLHKAATDIDESGILQSITTKVLEGINFQKKFKSIDNKRILSGINFNSGLVIQKMAEGLHLSKMLEGIDIVKLKKSKGFNLPRILQGIYIRIIKMAINFDRLPKQLLQLPTSTNIKETLRGVSSSHIAAAIINFDVLVKYGFDLQIITDGLDFSKIEGLDLSKIMEGIELKKIVPGIHLEQFLKGINFGIIMLGIENRKPIEYFPFIRGIDFKKCKKGINFSKIRSIPIPAEWMSRPNPFYVLMRIGLGNALRAQRIIPLIKSVVSAFKLSIQQSLKHWDEGCFTEPDYNYPGCDIGAAVKKANWKACRNRARGIDNARYWTFRMSDGLCWLKTININKKAEGKLSFISGNTGNAGDTSCGDGYWTEKDYNYPYYDIGASVKQRDWKACRDRAKVVTKAHYWVFRFSDGRCWLKTSNINRRVEGKGIYISGNANCCEESCRLESKSKMKKNEQKRKKK